MEYTPDCWVVLTIQTENQTIDKVFAGWHGDFLTGEHWKLSSGIVETTEYDGCFKFINHSGSVYSCYKDCCGLTNYMEQLLETWTAEPGVNVTVKYGF